MEFNDIIKHVEENEYSAFFYTPAYFKKSISYLLLKPIEIIPVYTKADVDYAFKYIQKLINKKFYAYSLINYEAGYLFEEKLQKYLNTKEEKLIQFVFFDKDQVNKIKSSEVSFNSISPEDYSIADFELNKTKERFLDDLKKIKNYQRQGDTYQVNYTVKGKFNFEGSYSSFYQHLLFNQSAKYSAFINKDDSFIISLSPELFFQIDDRKIVSRPMKGTSRRGYNLQSDEQALLELKSSDKNLAENIMIVDLIRNDLGRICKFESVKAPSLFETEKYESLFQMVSNVEGKLKKNLRLKKIVQSLFPCGSVTGAPKIRTMEIIKEIEEENRGIYTGSIGLITPKKIKMNVAIRTISLNKNSGKGVMGLGSGIVWDSNPEKEYEEVLLKSKFLNESADYFEIFETMRFEKGKINFIEDHISRMKSAADYFLFKFSFKKVLKQIDKATKEIDFDGIKKIRLTLNKWGNTKIEISDYPEIPENISIIISPNKINSADRFQHFKTTNRQLYDSEYKEYSSKGFYEVLYLNENAELSEGSRTNIFIKKNGQWFTPSTSSGALAGVYRKYFISKVNSVFELPLKLQDIVEADSMVLTNALIGEIIVRKVFLDSNEFIEYEN